MKNLRKINSVALLMLGFWFSTSAQITNRIFTIGNSVTDGINFGGFQAIANQRGNTHQLARHMIPGSPLFLLYNSTNSGFNTSPYGYWNTAFANYDWDCISFQPFDRDIMGSEGDFTTIEKWINYIKLHRGPSPQLQTYIYSRYPRTPQGKTELTSTKADWDNLWLGTYGNGGQTSEEKLFFERLLNTVRGANLLPKQTNLIPVGDVMYAMNQKMAAGSIPGFNKIWDFYSDGIHVNNYGSFMLASTFFATMYKQDPRGLTVPSQYGTIPDNVRDVILQTVYEIVFTHPFSGTTLLDIVTPTGVALSPKSNSLSFLQSYVLTATFSPSNTSNKNVTWSSSNPAIASINNAGRVVGVGTGVATLTGTTNIGGLTDFAVVTVSGLSNFTSTPAVLIGWDYANKPWTATGMNATFAHPQISTVNGNSFSSLGSGLLVRGDNFSNGSLMAQEQTAQDLTTSLSDNEFISFKVKPIDGKLVNINKFSFRANVQDGVNSFMFLLMSNVRGFNSSQIIGTFTGSSNGLTTISVTGHQNISQEVEFRLYMVSGPPFGQYSFVAIGQTTGNDCQIEGDIITPIDTEKPTSVTGLAASQITATNFFLSWNESSDNMIVKGYNVYNNGVKLNNAVIESTSFAVTSLTSGQICNITVTAVDFVGNESTPATIQVIANRPPTAVLNVDILSGAPPLTISYNANGSSDPDSDSGDLVLGFEYNFGNGSPIVNANSGTYTYTAPGIYTLSLVVVDTRGMQSTSVTSTITVSGTFPDVNAPSIPANLVVSSLTATSFQISWTQSIDNISLSGYAISINGISVVASQIGTTYSINGLLQDNIYIFSIQALDAAGNRSAIASISIITDITSPTTPTNLSFRNITSTSFDLTWTPSTDNISVTGYAISVNGVSVIASQVGTSYFATGLTPSTIYSIRIQALDAAGNRSLVAIVTTTTSAILDIITPTPPTNLVVSNLTATSLNLSWTASTDNISIAGYAISVNGILVSSTALGTDFQVMNLLPNTNYTIAIQAIDVAGNFSGIVTITVTTPVITSVNNISNSKSEVQIYPNPVFGDEVNLSENATGTIYDLLGNEVLKFKNTNKIDATKIKSGIYFVRLTSGKTIKLIVN